MQLFNQSERTFVFAQGMLKPTEVLEVEDKDAKNYVAMYPNELKILGVKEPVKAEPKETKKASK